jgi:uncharacterized protein YjbJ (UPF0337 family)
MEKRVDQSTYWEEIKEKIKETHVELTDADLEIKEGRVNEFLERIALKLNKTKKEVSELIEAIASNSNIAG